MFVRPFIQSFKQMKCFRPQIAHYCDGPNLPRFEKCLNQVNLLGRVGRDAEIRGTEQYPVAILSLATSFVYTKVSGETVSRTDWHRISVFKEGLRDKVASNVKKGDRIFVTGTLQYNEYWDSGNMLQKSTTIIANDIINLTKKYLNEDVPVDEENVYS